MAEGKDNGCCGPLSFENVTFTNVTLRGNIDGANVTVPPVNLTAGGVITGTLDNAHLNATMAASELQGQEFVNITLSGGGTTLNGNLSFDATAQSDVVALTSRYAGYSRSGVLNPGIPINVSDLMLRYDELANAINRQSGLFLNEAVLSGNLTIIDDGAQQSITGLFNDCNGTPHVPNATIPTCAQMAEAIANTPPPGTRYLKRTILQCTYDTPTQKYVSVSGTFVSSSTQLFVRMIAGGGGAEKVSAAVRANGMLIYNGSARGGRGGGGGEYSESIWLCSVGYNFTFTVGKGGDTSPTYGDLATAGEDTVFVGNAYDNITVKGGQPGHITRGDLGGGAGGGYERMTHHIGFGSYNLDDPYSNNPTPGVRPNYQDPYSLAGNQGPVSPHIISERRIAGGSGGPGISRTIIDGGIQFGWGGSSYWSPETYQRAYNGPANAVGHGGGGAADGGYQWAGWQWGIGGGEAMGNGGPGLIIIDEWIPF